MHLSAFFRYLVVGGICYLLNLGILLLSVEMLGMHYAAANLLSLGLMILVGHLLHRHQTFRSRGPYLGELGRFGAATFFQTTSAIAAMSALIEFAGAHYLLANLIVTAVFTLGSFLLQAYLVFRK